MRVLANPAAASPSFQAATEQGAAAGFARLVAAGTAPAGRPTATAHAGMLAALAGSLALVGAEMPQPRWRRIVRRGQELLSQLEELQHGLLAGEVPASLLRGLRGTLAVQPGISGDPRLDGILEEIELRAAIELAKLEKPAS